MEILRLLLAIAATVIVAAGAGVMVGAVSEGIWGIVVGVIGLLYFSRVFFRLFRVSMPGDPGYRS